MTKKVGRPPLSEEEKEKRKIEKQRSEFVTSLKKQQVALQKPRIGGRFVSKEIVEANEEVIHKQAKLLASGFITEEDRQIFGSNPMKFLELALQRVPTWVEGVMYARELKQFYLALEAKAQEEEEANTHKVLTWEWEGSEEPSDQKVTEDVTLGTQEKETK